MSALDSRIEELLGLELVADAWALLGTHTPVDHADAWVADYWTVRLSHPLADDPSRRVDMDTAYCRLRALADRPEAPRVLAARALRAAAWLHVARRLRDLAERDLTEAEERFGWDPEAAAVRVRLHLAFDEHDRARDVAEMALASADGGELRVAYAWLLYTVGDFDGALEQLEAEPSARRRLETLDLRGLIHASSGDLENEHAALSAAIALSPSAAGVSVRHLARGHAAAGLDRLDDARADFAAVIATESASKRDAFASYARRRLDALDVATPDTRHARLRSFPSVVQRWQYCGPAVIELCLRYAGIEMTQDHIAAAVKHSEGTAPLAILEFLKAQGFEARRVEATPAVVKRAIDLGFPVILQDDHVNTRHVVVAIGYDDRIGTVIVADPMTHAPVVQGVEAREALARGASYAGIVVMGSTEDLTPELASAATAAGIVDSEHLALLDEIDRRDVSVVPAFARATALEAAGLAERALAARPQFALASTIHLGSLLAAGLGDDVVFGAELASARLRHPDASRPAAMASVWNRANQRTSLAIAEGVLAITAEPRDAYAHAQLGMALLDATERVEAFEAFARSIALMPDSPAPTVGLALLLRDERIDRARRVDGHGLFVSTLAPSTAPRATLSRVDDALLATFARHVAEAAAGMAPDNAHVMIAQGDLAFLDGKADLADRYYRAAEAAAPHVPEPTVRRFLAHMEVGDHAAMRGLAEEIRAAGPRDAATWTAMIDASVRMGDERAAADVLAGIDAALDVGAMIPRWFAAAGVVVPRSSRSAAQSLVKHIGGMPHRGDVVEVAATALIERRLTKHAAELLHAVVAKRPDALALDFLLATLLARAPRYRAQAIERLERIVQQAPWVPHARLHLVWLLLGVDARRACHHAMALPDDGLDYLEAKRVACWYADRPSDHSRYAQAVARYPTGRLATDVAIGVAHLDAGRPAALAYLELTGSPDAGDQATIAGWCRVMRAVGRADEVVAFIADRPALQDVPEIARAYCELDLAAPAETRAYALRVVASTSTDPRAAIRARVRSLLAEGRTHEAERCAGDDAECLAIVATRLSDPWERARVASRARELAPDAPEVLIAVHAAALDVGQFADAFEAARELSVEDPFGPEGFARLSECETLLGDASRGLALALEAQAIAPDSADAARALTLAHAVQGEWTQAREHATRCLRNGRAPSPRASIAALVLAAAENDREAVFSEMEWLVADSPGDAYRRLFDALTDRVEGLPMQRS